MRLKNFLLLAFFLTLSSQLKAQNVWGMECPDGFQEIAQGVLCVLDSQAENYVVAIVDLSHNHVDVGVMQELVPGNRPAKLKRPETFAQTDEAKNLQPLLLINGTGFGPAELEYKENELATPSQAIADYGKILNSDVFREQQAHLVLPMNDGYGVQARLLGAYEPTVGSENECIPQSAGRPLHTPDIGFVQNHRATVIGALETLMWQTLYLTSTCTTPWQSVERFGWTIAGINNAGDRLVLAVIYSFYTKVSIMGRRALSILNNHIQPHADKVMVLDSGGSSALSYLDGTRYKHINADAGRSRPVANMLAVWKRPFPDVPAREYYSSAVARLKEKRVVQGTASGFFEPSRQTNHAEWLAMILREAGVPERDCDEHPVPGLLGDEWYCDYYSAASEKSLLSHLQSSACPSGVCPANPITRGEAGMIMMSLRTELSFTSRRLCLDAENIPTIIIPSTMFFIDWGNEKQARYATSFQFLCEAGVLNGREGDDIPEMQGLKAHRPAGTESLVRAEASVIIDRIQNY